MRLLHYLDMPKRKKTPIQKFWFSKGMRVLLRATIVRVRSTSEIKNKPIHRVNHSSNKANTAASILSLFGISFFSKLGLQGMGASKVAILFMGALSE